MNSSKFDDGNLRPTYMSQAEANYVMALWAERQREDAARQSLITVHDVAEATQLSTQDVERLLQEIRANQPDHAATQRRALGNKTSNHDLTLADAFRKILPYTALIAVVLGFYLYGQAGYWARRTGYDQSYRDLENLGFALMIYAFIAGVVAVSRYWKPIVRERIVFTARQRRPSRYDER